MFTFFNGESWGFAGSQRFVKDISTPFNCEAPFSKATTGCPFIKGACAVPFRQDTDFTEIRIERVKAVLELNQIGHSFPAEPRRFFVHVNDNSTSNADLARTVVEAAPAAEGQSQAILVARAVNNYPQQLPPTSASSFIKGRQLPAAVLGDFQSQYSE